MSLDRKSGSPLYRILSTAVKQCILEQRLAPGAALPSARQLAKQYHLSVSTALRAYEELASQGYVVTSPKSGSRVADNFDGHKQRTPKSSAAGQTPSGLLREAPLSVYGQRLLFAEQLTAAPPEAGVSIPGADLLPTSVWQKLLTKYQDCYEHETALYDYTGECFGHRPLREAIADFLKRSRGIRCNIEQIVVTSAVRLDLACRILLDVGDRVAIENPSFPAARKVLLSHGAELQAINADSDGLNPEPLFASPNNRFRMLYLCPSHQDPSGVALSLERRHLILKWSQRTDTIIWENDFDCNYYYTETPLPAMHSLVENDTVIYSGSFWLSLGPLASSGFLVVPQRYVKPFQSLLSAVQSERPVLENYALTEFISEGHLERRIHKQRTLYAKRRQALMYELTLALRQLVTFKASSGLHILIQFDPGLAEQKIVACAREAGFALMPTQSYYMNDHPPNEFIIPFADFDEKTISSVAKHFAALLLGVG